MYRLKCPHCKVGVTYKARHAGTPIDCPRCEASISIPELSKWARITEWGRSHKFAFFTGLCSAVALPLAIIFWLFPISPAPEPIAPSDEVIAKPVDDLVVTKVRPIIDQPTRITESGVMSLHWEMVLSNNGTNDLSITEYDTLQVTEEGSLSYSGLRQGLYLLDSDALSPVQFPIVIPAGHSQALFIRLGVKLDVDSLNLVRKEFADKKPADAAEIIDFLRSNETDLFGNPFTRSDIGAYSLPPIDEINEPTFGISFRTARRQDAAAIISWYKYGLFRERLPATAG